MNNFVIYLILFSFHGFAQFKIAQVKVDQLENPFSGGLNTPQFSQINLNGDQLLDLIAFDRMGGKFFAYTADKKNNKIAYTYAPQYERFFPVVENWALLYDYNQDNKPDLFCNTIFGIKAYKNVTNGNYPKWELVKDPVFALVYQQQTNIVVNDTDLPALTDVDSDGDMDILTFNALTGFRIEFYKNMSKETYGHADSLVFKLEDNCFGGLEEISCGNFNFGLSCQVARLGYERVQHLGSSSILAFDPDGDGDKDLIISKGECLKVSYLQNVGTSTVAKFKSATYGYPATKPVNLYAFPSAFWMDLDGDEKKDLLFSPQVSDNANRLADTKSSSWYYSNTSSTANAQYEFQQNDFLQGSAIDLGENAAPAFLDYDLDGDLDLLFGNKGLKINDSTYAASLHLYNNVGSKKEASYMLDTIDYLGLAAFKLGNFIPQIIDYDANGTKDLILTTTNLAQLSRTQVVVIPNTSTGKYNFDLNNIDTLDLVVNIEDVPFFIDNDQDNDLDAFVAKANGSLLYYENNSNSYVLKITGAGGLVSNPFRRFLAAHMADFDQDNKLDLLYGENTGILKLVKNYKDVTNFKMADSTFIFNELSQNLTDYHFAKRMIFTSGDLNDDNIPDLLVGGNTGGLWLLLSEKEFVNTDSWECSLFPNPSKGIVHIKVNLETNVEIYNLLGQKIASHLVQSSEKSTQISIESLSHGIYLFKCSAGKRHQTFKIVKD